MDCLIFQQILEITFVDGLIADNAQFAFPFGHTVDRVGSIGLLKINVQLLGLVQPCKKPGERMRNVAGAGYRRRKIQPPLPAGTIKLLHPLYLVQDALGIAQKFLSLRGGQNSFGGAFKKDNAQRPLQFLDRLA